jgi:threonine/homoserine/homoserine lactone efflux protein
MDTLFAYVAVTAILVITPGSTTAVVVRNTLSGGRGAGLAAALGAAAANATHATAAGLGLGLVLARWPLSLTFVRFFGAAYLVWLGANSIRRAAAQSDASRAFTTAGGAEATASARRAIGFRQGLAVNLLNPAIATFYLVVVPSFARDTLAAGFVSLAAIHVSMALVCHAVWATGFDRLRRALDAPGARRVLEAATGVALLTLAAQVALS